MSEPQWGAWVDDDDCFRYRDFDQSEATWATAADLAQDWWADSVVRNGHKGEWRTRAQPLVDDLLRDGHPAVVDVLQALVDSATSDEELDYVGASPLEDLISHNHHGARFVDEIERRARQQPRFRAALTGVWLAGDVPEQVRQRLGVLGAKLL